MDEQGDGFGAAQLVSLRPDLLRGAVTLAAEVYTIGRARSCHIVLSDPQISRLHAKIEWQGARYMLTDTGSANGTSVNGRRISGSVMLGNDDVIGLGPHAQVLRFVDPDATAPAHGALYYDERQMSFMLGGARLELTSMQRALLGHLYRHAGDVCTRESCAEAMWGRDFNPGMDSGALDQAMNSLRKALREAGADERLIETRRGLGYVLNL